MLDVHAGHVMQQRARANLEGRWLPNEGLSASRARVIKHIWITTVYQYVKTLRATQTYLLYGLLAPRRTAPLPQARTAARRATCL